MEYAQSTDHQTTLIFAGSTFFPVNFVLTIFRMRDGITGIIFGKLFLIGLDKSYY